MQSSFTHVIINIYNNNIFLSDGCGNQERKEIVAIKYNAYKTDKEDGTRKPLLSTKKLMILGVT